VNKTSPVIVKFKQWLLDNPARAEGYEFNFDYYKFGKSPIEIYCKKHNEYFYNLPKEFKENTHSCNYCRLERLEQGIIKSNSNQIASSLISFKKWVKSNKDYTENFKYFYETYEQVKSPMKVYCKKHRTYFYKNLIDLREKHGCEFCYKDKLSKAQSENNSFNKKELESRFPLLDFSETIYIDAYTPLKIYCKKHKEYFYKDYDHLRRGQGCKKCSNSGISRPERYLVKFLKQYTDVIENYRPKWMHGLELDIYLPNFKLAIEHNGVYWHSENFKHKNYHKEKTDLCNDNNINLFHIWEDELRDHPNIIYSMLLNKLNLTPFKIGARKCNIKKPTLKEANSFLNENHLLGGNRGVSLLGLYYEDELLCVMYMKKMKGIYNLTKFATKTYTLVQGGFSKLLKAFNIQTDIISYSEDRWSTGNLYLSNGFKFSHKSPPNYFYTKSGITYNKKNFTKKKLEKRYKVKVSNERDFMYNKGYRRIYESGLSCYIKVKG